MTHRERARELLKHANFDDSADYFIYILEFRRHDGEVFYYVGLTSDVLNRVTVHISKKNVWMPNIMGELQKGVSYEIVDILEAIPVFGSRERARNVERRRSFEIAIEFDSTNILGGS